jgi:RNA polymerase sigma-70 factor (ECF subfamily)
VDRETFHCFYEDTASALRAYLRLTCRDATLADDLMQETYLRMLRRQLPELDTVQRKAYLFKTAHSVLADHYRARRREARGKEEYSLLGRTGSADGCDSKGRDDRSVLDPLELPFDIQRVLDTLKAREQSLLWLAYVEGFKHDEIAEVVGVSASSVRVLLSRARARLAAKLRDQGLAPRAGRGGRNEG